MTMSNIEVHAPLVDGSLFPFHENDDSCKSLVTNILGDDLRPPPRGVTIQIKTELGRTVRISIPNGDSNALVFVDDEQI